MFNPQMRPPSQCAKSYEYDVEGRLHEFNHSRQSTGGIGASNSLYDTEAEQFDACAPHLRAARIRDAQRRNYIVQPGGAILYRAMDNANDDPYDDSERKYEVPRNSSSFGHDFVEGTRPVHQGYGESGR